MSKVNPTSKAAHFITESLLFIPRGIFLPIARLVDAIRDALRHKQIACKHCTTKSVPLEREVKSKLYFNTVRSFQNLQLYLFRKIHDWLPDVSIFKKKWISDFAKKYGNQALSARNTIVWKYLIPASIFALCVGIWGIGIVPQVYIFFSASFWAGKILNHGANLLVRQKHSEEWIFLCRLKRDLSENVRILKDHPYYQPLRSLCKRLLFEAVLIGITGGISQFLSYGFNAFFSWFVLYALVKQAAEEMPLMLEKFEKKLSTNFDHEKANNMQNGYRVGNALWLISYHTFKLSSSLKAQKKYQKLHEMNHHAAIGPNQVWKKLR